MLRLLSPRAIPVTAACLCWMAASVLPVQAEENEILEWREIVKQLGQGGKERIAVVGSASQPPQPQSPPRVALPAIQFEYDSDRLTGSALLQVTELAEALEHGNLQPFYFAVQGHTDSIGSEAYNRALSLRRARAAKRHLVGNGVSGSRLVEVGLGEGFPIAGVASDDGRNRRVEIVNLGSLPSAASARKGRGRALLIGIDEYWHVSRLKGPVNDARAMKSFIVDRAGFDDGDVKMLLDSEATRENVLAAIDDWLIRGTEAGDEVFLFFSGHGFQQPDANGDEADRLDETLVPVDASVGEDGTIAAMITDDEMASLLDRLTGRRTRVMIDACHSGTSDRFSVVGESWRYVKTPRRPDGRPIRVMAPGRTRSVADSLPESFLSAKDPGVGGTELVVWTAVKAEQKALVDEESTGEPGSVFTRRVLWGARDGKADRDRNGVVTRSELHGYLVRESEAYCERRPHRCPRGLTPQIHAAPGGLEQAAFAGTSASMPAMPVAKDVLVRQAERLVARVDAGSGAAGVELRIEPSSELAIGSSLDIVVESDRDGYLVLLDIDTAGNMVQIFPNEFSRRSGVSDRLRAGRPLRLPGTEAGFRFQADPPTGSGTLIAIVSDRESAQLQSLVSRHKDLSVVPRPDAYLVEMDEALRVGGDSRRRATALDYEVVAP